MSIGSSLRADEIVLSDREPAGLVEERDDLLDIRARCGRLIVANEEWDSHDEEHADHGDEYDQLGEAEAGLSEGAPAFLATP
jgi:hypothetical protein